MAIIKNPLTIISSSGGGSLYKHNILLTWENASGNLALWCNFIIINKTSTAYTTTTLHDYLYGNGSSNYVCAGGFYNAGTANSPRYIRGITGTSTNIRVAYININGQSMTGSTENFSPSSLTISDFIETI